MKVFISADIEGVTGLVSWAQCGRPTSDHYDFAFARRMMTQDVNAAIRGARTAGATKVVVKDSHGGMRNLLVDQLEPGVELISGSGAGTEGMMQGLDGTFHCALLVGYHAMAGTLGGIMEHTVTGGVHRLKINGKPAGEIALSAGLAGAFGVPVVMISSDKAGCDEGADLIPKIETFATKHGIGRYMGRLLHPAQTMAGIETAARQGVQKFEEIRPVVFTAPIRISIEFNRSEEADIAAMIPGVQRTDAYTCEAGGSNFLQVHQMAWSMFETSLLGANANK